MGKDISLAAMPGKCESCNRKGQRFRYYNPYAEPAIEMDLCPKCMETAFKCMAFFFQTPAGRKAIDKRRQMQGT